MILATFSLGDGLARLGLVRRTDASVIDLQQACQQINGQPDPALASMLDLIASGLAGLQTVRELDGNVPMTGTYVHALSAVKLLSPVPTPPQMRDFSVFETHMRQAAVGMARLRGQRTGSGAPVPKAADINLPEVFFKQPLYYKTNRFSVVGHEHEVTWPKYARLMDYELECGIFLSKGGKNIPLEQAREYIFGYTIFNDFSARDAQELEMNGPLGPAKGKDFDSGNAVGPWIVTADEIADAYNLTMVARVNGEEWSRGNTRDMVHGFEEMIAHVSRDETLHAGEFFGSGTAGGGCGLEIDRWLQPGDVVELEVEGIGVLRNRLVRPATV